MLVIPIRSELHAELQDLAQNRRMVFVTGLPGVGKSLMIQQLALIAAAEGRTPHLLQYTIAREPFETNAILNKYPEVDGFTDPAIRKAVGQWARDAIVAWDAKYPEDEHLLIGEVPLIGNRFIELVEKGEDSAEILLSRNTTEFVVPVPSWEVREVIEQRRAETIASPQHEREKLDAPPNVLRALWREVNILARQIRLTKAHEDTKYNPYIYGGVYEALLQYRQSRLLLIEQVLRPAQSVYETGVMASHLQASPDEVRDHIGRIESTFTPDTLTTAVENWHAIVTQNPKPIDRGAALTLPLPEALSDARTTTQFTGPQRKSLRALMALPLDATTEQTLPILDAALVSLASEPSSEKIQSGVKKFDVFDDYFNVSRSAQNAGVSMLHGLLFAYRNVLENLNQPPQPLTVVEQPLLRIAIETTLRQFSLEDPC